MSVIAQSLTLTLPDSVRSYLRRYALRRAVQRIVRRIGLAVFVTIMWGVAWCLVDRAVALPAGVRLALLLINVAVAVLLIGPAVVRTIRGVDWLNTARDIERREPDWRERLATLASRALGPRKLAGSAELLSALAADVEAEASQRQPADLLPWSRTLRPWVASAVALLLTGSLTLVPALDLPRLARRYLMPLSAVAPAATTRLFVTPGDISIAAGEALRVRTSVQRMAAGSPTLHVRTAGARPDEWIEQTMSATPQGAFEARVPNVERDLEYFVTGGDAHSEVYRATVLRRPAVAALRVQLDFPPYLKLPPRVVSGSDGALEAPAGTQVTLEIEASEPLDSARVTLGRETVATAPTDRANVRKATFTAQSNQPLAILMTSGARVEGVFAGGSIRVHSDRPPVVTASAQGSQNPAARMIYHAIDDLALSRIDAEISRGYGQKKILSLPLAGGVREQSDSLALDASSFGLEAGEIVDVQLRVEDRAGHFTVSQPVRLIVAAAAPAPPGAAKEPSDPSQAIDIQGFSDPLDAYFQVISKAK